WGLFEQSGQSAGQLLGTYVLHVRGDGPAVPERIDDEGVPVAVELIFRSALHGRAEFDGPRHHGVDILDVDELEDWAAGQAAGRWGLRSVLRVLVRNDDHRVADLDLGVGDAPVRAGKPHPLGRAEHLGVEVQGLRGALHDQAGRDPAVRVGNRVRLGWHGHVDLPRLW